MKHQRSRQGFTLIELLVVIGVITVLMAMVIPAVRVALDKGKVAAARTAVLSIETAWKTYFQEYGKWPVDNGNRLLGQPAGELGQNNPSLGIEVTDEVVSLLTGDPDDNGDYRKDKHNPKGIQFLEINQDSLVKQNPSDRYGTFVDPWGNPYRFLFDLDYDNRIRHKTWSGSWNQEPIAKSVIAWSPGENAGMRDPGSQEDDIVSW